MASIPVQVSQGLMIHLKTSGLCKNSVVTIYNLWD